MKLVIWMTFWLFTFSTLAQPLSTKVLSLKGANAEDKSRIEKALKLIEQVVNSEDFKQQVLHMAYSVHGFTFYGYSQTTLTPEEVLYSILEAEENFTGGTPGTIDLFLEMYHEVSSTIGYTSPTDKFIHMNRYFHEDYTAVETANNLFHEWLHKINHDHSRWHNPFRPHSVPYKLGNLLAEMAAELEANGDPLKKELILKEVSKNAFLDCSRR